ncbi:MAG: hypothetical protein JRI52_09080 [Deltaproteobacteria bacterium]|nr:hypothetical protein [Deltaproteobacteria bacterium]
MTYDFTIAAAETLTKLNEELTFCFLSGAGTDPTMKSRFMWARIKGEAERDLESNLQYNNARPDPIFIF